LDAVNLGAVSHTPLHCLFGAEITVWIAMNFPANRRLKTLKKTNLSTNAKPCAFLILLSDISLLNRSPSKNRRQNRYFQHPLSTLSKPDA
jgi:hypothetical protein